MPEGGNDQFSHFSHQHSLGNNGNIHPISFSISSRLNVTGARRNDSIEVTTYKTKVAKFYREILEKHIKRVKLMGNIKEEKFLES